MERKILYSVFFKAFRNTTIKRKLISIIMLTCTTSLILVGVMIVVWQWFGLRQSMVRSLSTQAKVIADNCKASIAFEEPQDSYDVLQSLKSEPTIVFGGVYNVDGEIFATYFNGGENPQILNNQFLKGSHIFEKDLLTVFEPIIVEEKAVGTVCLRSTLAYLHGMLKRNIAVVFGAVMLASLLVFFVSSELQKIISKPILDLADVAEVVSENQEYSIRVKKTSNDEIGLLIEAFNGMLAQIQQRDLALVNANEQLEKKVEERTYDLKEEVVVRREAEVKLAQTVRKLTLSNRELREFTRIAAHDLQTPLRAIGILSDWISEDYTKKCDDEGRKNAKLLTGRAKRMSQLLNAVIQYSELSLIDRRQEYLDLKLIISQVIENIQIPDNIEVTIDDKLPIIIGVRSFIYDLFKNLIINAVSCIDKPNGYVKIDCKDDGDFWKFSISDNGTGIEEKYFDKIFKIFQMLTLRDKTENTGIGLSIVKKIVELYDGRIWLESEVGQGTTFFFTFPKSKVEVPDYEESLVSSV